MANLIRGLSENGGVVFCGVDATEIVRKAEKLHTTSATCSAALGRLLTGAALMGSMLKDDRDKITLRVAGRRVSCQLVHRASGVLCGSGPVR